MRWPSWSRRRRGRRDRRSPFAPPTDAPIRNPAVIYRPQGDGWSVLVNADNARSVALNPTADAVWRAVNGYRELPAIVAVLDKEFHGVPPSAAHDVAALLEELAQGGFIGYDCAATTPAPDACHSSRV